MAFVLWIFLLLPAMGLYVLVEAIISPFAEVLGPVLKLLNDPVFSYWASWVLLVWNVLVLAALLIVLTNWAPKKVTSLHPIVFIGLSAAVGVVFGFAGA